MAEIKHTTLLGRELVFEGGQRDLNLFARLVEAPTVEAAEEMLPGKLRDPRWAYYVDAVDRVRARVGSLRVRRVVDAPIWSTSEVARSLGVSVAAVQLLASSRRLYSTKINGRSIFSRHEVEAFELVRSGPSASRVPALYVTAGTLPTGESMRVAVLNAAGARVHGDALSSRDTPQGSVCDLVFDSWAEAVLVWGTPDNQRGRLITPEDRPASRITLGPGDELGATGRWNIVEETTDSSRAASMHDALVERAKESK